MKLLSFRNEAEKLSAKSAGDIKKAALIIKQGGIIAFPFNGIYGLFGDVANKRSADKIFKAKNRPRDKNLIIVSLPEHIDEHSDFSKVNFSHPQLVKLLKEIHALGVILPALETAPNHLILKGDGLKTVLSIWTEYAPLRALLGELRKLGVKSMVGTSANKNGQPTHYKFETLWKEFKRDVEAIVEADFSHLSVDRYKSTTVLDMSEKRPRLHRLGNVSEAELKQQLKKHEFLKLTKLRDVIVVQNK